MDASRRMAPTAATSGHPSRRRLRRLLRMRSTKVHSSEPQRAAPTRPPSRQIDAAADLDRLPGDVAASRGRTAAPPCRRHPPACLRGRPAGGRRREWRRPARGRRARAADLSRHHAIDGDAAWPYSTASALVRPTSPALADDDMGAPRRSYMRGDAADIDDPPPPFGKHAGDDRTAAQEGAVEHHGHDGPPVREGHLGEGGFPPVGGIVDEDVDAAEVARRSLPPCRRPPARRSRRRASPAPCHRPPRSRAPPSAARRAKCAHSPRWSRRACRSPTRSQGRSAAHRR